MDLSHHLLRGDETLVGEMAAPLRHHLVLELQRLRPALGEDSSRAQHVECVAEPGICVNTPLAGLIAYTDGLLLLLLARCFFYMSFIRAGKRAADFAGDSRFTHICRSRHKYADNTYGKRNLRPKKDIFFRLFANCNFYWKDKPV